MVAAEPTIEGLCTKLALDHEVQGTATLQALYQTLTRPSFATPFLQQPVCRTVPIIFNTLSPVTHPLLVLSLLLNYLSVSALIFMYMLNNSYTPCIPVTLFGLFHYVHSVYKCYAIVCLLRINL